MKQFTDTELLDWLENSTKEGHCPGIIFDDNGHWTVAFDSFQNVPIGDGPQDINTTFFVEKDKWKPSIREAIIAAIEENKLEAQDK